MKKKATQSNYYIIIDSNNSTFIRKYLSKVEYLTNINSTTLSKHFSRTTEPYKKAGYIVYKTKNIDLKSFNKGNTDNLSFTRYTS